MKGIRFNFRKLFHKPLKVGFVTYGNPTDKKGSIGGSDIYGYYLSRGLAKLGAEVHVFCAGNKNMVRVEYLGEGKLVIHTVQSKMDLDLEEKSTGNYLIYLLFNNKVVEAITKENKKEKFDLINSNGGLISGVFIAKYFNNIRWICTFHCLEKNRLKSMSREEKKLMSVFNWVESSVYYADSILAVSKSLKEEILKEYGVNSEKVYYVPNGVDTNIFNTNEAKKEKKVSYIGRFSSEKGIDYIPTIAREVLMKTPEIKFEVIAPDKNANLPEALKKTQQEMEDLVKEFPERFIWHREGLNRQKVADIFKSSILTIQPSRYESFGLTVLESMACGSVPIVSNRGGMPEVVDNSGVVVPLSSKAFVRNILKLLEDYRLRERHHRRCVERAKEFDWDNIVSKTYDLFKVIARKEESGKGETEEREKVVQALENIEKSIGKNE